MAVFFVRVEKNFCTRTKSFFVVKQNIFFREKNFISSLFTIFHAPKFTISYLKKQEREPYKKNIRITKIHK